VSRRSDVEQACRCILDPMEGSTFWSTIAGFNVKARRMEDLCPRIPMPVIAANLSELFIAIHSVLAGDGVPMAGA